MTTDVEQMCMDMAAGTPGPWPMETVRTSCGVCHKIGPWPHKWRHGQDMSACIYDDYPSPPEGTDTMLANARRIARLPDLEIDYLALAEEIARLRAALKPFADIGVGTDPDYQPQIRLDRDAILAARAALGETK